MRLPAALSRLFRWRWSRTLALIGIFVALAFILIPDRSSAPVERPLPSGHPAPVEPVWREPRGPVSGAHAGAPDQPVHGASSAAPADDPPGELPVWERPPRKTSQPFPEGARLEEPRPPIRLPPGMLAEPPPPSPPGAAPADAEVAPPTNDPVAP
jgi:hypothetical protein